MLCSLCSANAQSVEMMVLGRFMVGIGIGVNTSLVPLYISEVSSLPPLSLQVPLFVISLGIMQIGMISRCLVM